MTGARRQRGFSLLELVIVIILVIVLFLIVFDRLLPMRGQAEAAHVDTVIGSLRSAIGLQSSQQVVTEGLDSLAEMAGANPVTYLQEWPDNYIGQYARPPDTPPAGSWYFRNDTGTLNYRVRFPQYLQGSPAAPVDLGWRIELHTDDDSGRPLGLRLRPLDPHRWPDELRGRRPPTPEP